MIDWEQVDRLNDDMGESFAEIVEVFIAEADAAVSELSQTPEGPERAAALHFLKGAALNLGFAEFGALCAAGEHLARAGSHVDNTPIMASYQASRTAFLAGLAARAPS